MADGSGWSEHSPAPTQSAGGLDSLAESRAVQDSFVEPDHHESNEHLALIYEETDEQFSTVIPFIREGLERGGKCIYVVDDNSQAALVDAMQAAGIEVDDARRSGDLEILTRDTYLAGETFDPDDQLTHLTAAIESATSDYPSVRVAVEMTCFLEEGLSYEDLVAYEERYNSTSEEVPAMALCQYNRQRFPPAVIRDVIRAHPHLIIDGTLSHNVHYTPPDRFFGSTGPEDDIERMVQLSTDLAQAEAQLKRKNDRLEQFASIVSHDLRNPLRVAEGQLVLAREDPSGEHLDAVANAHRRMDELIDDILSFARADEPLEALEPVRLEAIVTDCWEHVPTGDAKLVVDTDCTIRADRNRLQQLLENLLRNAVEHAERAVTITVGELPDDPGFYVEDDGPGIPVDRREKAFEVGYSTSEGGTGLGLSIVKDIAEAHGWSVRIATGADHGTRFEFRV